MFKFLKKFFAVPTAEEIKKEMEAKEVKVEPSIQIQPIINQPEAVVPTPKKKSAPKPAKATSVKKTPAKKVPAKPKKK